MGDRAEAVFELPDVFRGPPAVVQAQIEKRRSTVRGPFARVQGFGAADRPRRRPRRTRAGIVRDKGAGISRNHGAGDI